MFSHEIRRISKDQQLPGMVRPMFLNFGAIGTLLKARVDTSPAFFVAKSFAEIY